MANKTLNTRVQLKYDSYTKWQAVEETFIPLKGELCIVNPGTALNNATNVPCLMKVGDGNTIFKNLPWVSATAADVYTWAKQSTLPIKVTGNGNAVTVIEFGSWTETVNGATVTKEGLLVTKGETFATAAQLSALSGRVDAIDTDLDTRYSFDIPTSGNNAGKLVITSTLYTKGVAGTPTEKTLDLVTPGELEELLKGYIKSVRKVDNTAIEVVYDTADTNHQNPKVGFKIAATQGDKVTVTQSNDGLKVEVNQEHNHDNAYSKLDHKHVPGDITGFNDAVAAIKVEEAGHADTATNATNAVNATNAQEAVHAASADNATNATNAVNAQEATHAASADNATNAANASKLENRTTAELKEYLKEQFEGSIADGDTGFVTGDAVYDVKAIADAAKARIDAFIEGTDDATAVIDTLVEIQEFMTADTGAFVALSERVSDIEDGTTTVPKAAHAINADDAAHANEASHADNADEATHAVNADEATHAGHAASADYATEAGHADTADYATDAGHAENADNATKAADSDKLGGQLPDYYATADSVTAITEDDGIIDDKIDAYDASKGFGNIITHNHSEYATAAQGTKADTAVQSISICGIDATVTDGAASYEAGTLPFLVGTEVATGNEYLEATIKDGMLGKYAELTVTQNAKDAFSAANSAIQSITSDCTGTGDEHAKLNCSVSGLKVTQETGSTTVNIEIDDSITFIFNCGGAPTNN